MTDLSQWLNQIHHIDALDLLAQLPDESIDMVLCDLPYGVTACAWDTIIPIDEMWQGLKRIVKSRAAIVLTATQPFTSRLVSSNYEMFRYEWIWLKDNGSDFLNVNRKPFKAHENVLVFYTKQPVYNPQKSAGDPYEVLFRKGLRQGLEQPDAVLDTSTINFGDRYPKSYQKFSHDRGLHPTQKPVALFEYLIKTYTLENEIVLDMTCGSGTTAIAARKTNRQFICGDNHLPYVELARKRLQDTDPYQDTVHEDGTTQLSLFRDSE